MVLKKLKISIYTQRLCAFVTPQLMKKSCFFMAKMIDLYKEKIEVFFLPAYAPKLNPDEMLNRNVKSNITYSNLFTSQNDLIATLKSYLFSLQYNSSKVKSFFGFDEVFYASQ